MTERKIEGSSILVGHYKAFTQTPEYGVLQATLGMREPFAPLRCQRDIIIADAFAEFQERKPHGVKPGDISDRIASLVERYHGIIQQGDGLDISELSDITTQVRVSLNSATEGLLPRGVREAVVRAWL